MNYLIIGNGVAGTEAAANIRKMDGEGKITIVTKEAYPFYSRIRLIDFLSEGVDEKGLAIKNDGWYEENKIELILNAEVTDIDYEKKAVILSSGRRMRFDRLLLSMGSVCYVPPIPGVEKPGVFTLRTLKDAIAIREYARTNRRLLLIGGGVLGLEAGNALRKTGSSVTVVEYFPRLLPRQMDNEGAAMLRAQMEAMGFKFHLGVKSKEILGDGHAGALMLEDGRRIDCDMIIVSAGVRPDTACAGSLKLNVGKGIVVNDRMETGLPDVYAAGDVAEHRGVCYGIWPAAQEQGKAAGINMAGGTAFYEGTVMSNRLKAAGIDLVSAGDIDPEGKSESIVSKDPVNYIYKKLVIKDNIIAGAILLGDTKDRAKIIKTMEDKTDISPMRKGLENWNLEALEGVR
ncbi:MAG: FAD-dependent oxidoreductase [Thermodesulfovibrionales bacterium]|nr:FAD-dependent oxidoreductase [Thermodesulfovibrionales bacterium]